MLYRGVFMAEELRKQKHTMVSENRELLELGGITDVGAFNEEEIAAVCDYGTILIKGLKLHIEALDLESGQLKISGKIGAIVYNDASPAKGFFKRVFS